MAQQSKASAKAKRLRFGPHKYYALNLMLARWLRHHAVPGAQYHYVTLGGTELRDIVNAGWIDRLLITTVTSFEQNAKNAALAQATADQLATRGVHVAVINDDIFAYRRAFDTPHIFYVDLMGICRPKPHLRYFADWFQYDVLRPGDLVLITSYLGRNIGWPKVLEDYDAEFRLLRYALPDEQKSIYHRAHPLFVLNRALNANRLEGELELRALGAIRYTDTSPMGLYGIVVQEGATALPTLVANLPFWSTGLPSVQ